MPGYTLQIRRYDPESGQAAYWAGLHGRPAARALGARRDPPGSRTQDGSIGIRCSCQAAICGSCGVRINGKSRLACNTKIGEAAERAQVLGNGRDRRSSRWATCP